MIWLLLCPCILVFFRSCYSGGLQGLHEKPLLQVSNSDDQDAPFAIEYIKEQGAPIVIKADGLTAGKGVIVARTLDEAYEAVDSMLMKGDFSSADGKIIVEEYLEREEASFFALVDGENAIALESAQDHKRIGDGDTGPNTGGMGTYFPAPILTPELQSTVMSTITVPTIRAMAEEGCKMSGLPKLIGLSMQLALCYYKLIMTIYFATLRDLVHPVDLVK
ncbi:hypothetical protein MLD38_027873 [Melastoma candidum]|uniref:Uncharacterized protein n=1 Tax=Melastoma candidum TaxID=119954 RepID=A0ACB9N0V9_9MYRT|nr:hypothetical protein MLD38_027873 [Melastoma candidum]